MLDSNFMLGDGVWEGIRLHKGVLTAGHEHITRLFEGSKSLDMDLQVRECRAYNIRLFFEQIDTKSRQNFALVFFCLIDTEVMSIPRFDNCALVLPFDRN